MIFRYTVHPKGLDPFQAAKAWHLRCHEGLPWKAVRSLVRTVSGAPPGQDALEDAVARVDAQRCTATFKKSGVADARYANCGRAPLLSTEQKQSVVALPELQIPGEAPRKSRICDPFGNSFALGTHFVTICDSFVTDLWPVRRWNSGGSFTQFQDL